MGDVTAETVNGTTIAEAKRPRLWPGVAIVAAMWLAIVRLFDRFDVT